MPAFPFLDRLEWLYPLAAFLLTFFGLQVLLRSGMAVRMAVDTPNHRSLHHAPTPRIGGIVLAPSFLLVWAITGWNRDVAIMVAALVALSYLDDRSGLPVALRLAGQVGAAAVFGWLQLPSLGYIPIAIAVLWIVWSTNLYNFMDGADGVAGGMGAFGFLALGIAAVTGGNAMLAAVCFSISAASLGFLTFNVPPAKVFMGDAGSISLGFLSGALGLLGWQDGAWPLWFPPFVFSPFVVDATVTLFRRAFRLERVWVAHRDHYYQRLIRMGWSHRKLALFEYALMGSCAISALALLDCPPQIQYVGFAVWAVLYAAVMIKIDRCWIRYSAIPA